MKVVLVQLSKVMLLVIQKTINMENIQSIKQRFGIIGNDIGLNRAIEKSIQVAPTDISVLITGESGVGKEVFPKIIHQLSHRKHGKFIAVNCGAIPEGTIDSELFGHEKGAFTGATQTRSGYFEVADGGTIFLDEVGELPLTTQVRLLRVLENGEFIKVGSSNVQKTNVRIVAATNIKMFDAIKKNKFREDLYYRLSTVEIEIPALRKRNQDIHLLFRKFSSDFALKYKMPTIRLDAKAINLLQNYRWPGNVRQLRNFSEQISVLESKREIDFNTIKNYLPDMGPQLPAIIQNEEEKTNFSNEREILYKVLFDMKNDLNDLKKLTLDLMENGNYKEVHEKNEQIIKKINREKNSNNHINENRLLTLSDANKKNETFEILKNEEEFDFNDDYEEEIKETLSLHDKELELIKKSLERHKGKRKLAAEELGISERTLYRKIKQYDL